MHRRVWWCALDPGELRVPREARPRERRGNRRGVQVGRAHRAHDLGFDRRKRVMTSTASGFQETRIITKRLHDRPDESWTIDGALASDGYAALREVLANGDPAGIQQQVSTSGLRGRGGANFATGQKWSFLPAGITPRYLVVNADE